MNETERICRIWHESWEMRDPDRGAAIIHPECRFEDVARGEAQRGPEAYKRDYERWRTAFPEGTLEIAKLPTPFREGGTITAGNASGVNDGSCALIVASEEALGRYNLTPRARVIASAVAGVEPRIMGVGPAPASRKVLSIAGLSLDQMDTIELNEAFASQSLAVLRELGLSDDSDHVNPNGGAIALGHPLGMSGARLITTAINQLEEHGGRFGLCTMCIGVGQGIATIIERVQ